jgi:hypothetical protein
MYRITKGIKLRMYELLFLVVELVLATSTCGNVRLILYNLGLLTHKVILLQCFAVRDDAVANLFY